MISNNVGRHLWELEEYTWWTSVFTDDELDEITKYCSALEMEKGMIGGSGEGGAINNQIRTSNTAFFSPNESNYYIFEKFNKLIDHVNTEYYQFDLIGYENIQYSEYKAEEEGKYDFHMDLFMGEKINITHREKAFNRKLSLVLLLSEPGVDFEGGEFEMNVSKEERSRKIPFKKGMVILFPSFILHRVTPVTKGLRKSLVTWVCGPKFK